MDLEGVLLTFWNEIQQIETNNAGKRILKDSFYQHIIYFCDLSIRSSILYIQDFNPLIIRLIYLSLTLLISVLS